MMHTLRLLCSYILGALILLAGITHFRKPRLYLRIVPAFLPMREAIVWISGIVEVIAGIGMFIPAWRHDAALLVFWMMIVFLPLHVWDVFRDKPAMGSHKLALIRLPLQFVLIAWAWWVS